MNSLLRALVLALSLLLLGAAPQFAADSPAPLPGDESSGQRDVRLRWWRDARFGLFIHWGPSSLSGKEISWARIGHPHDHAGEMQTIPPEEYDNLYRRFDPVKFNADAWMKLARRAGMKYVVFTTKHHDGFSMWPTRLRSDYSISATPFKRDICGELAEAAHRNGLKLGWYYSTRDWTHPDYLKDGNTRYNEFYHGQVNELLSNYGRVDMLWFDHVAGNWGDYRFRELFEMMYRLQPGLLVNNRAAAFIQPTRDQPEPGVAKLVRGDFDTPEQQIGKFQNDRPWESCVTLTHCADGGGWSYRPDGRTRGFEECVQMLVNCASGDGNLLLNVGPLPDGEIDPRQVNVLERIGAWLERYGESIYATRGGPYRNGKWGGSVYRDRSVYLHVFEWKGATLRLPPLRARILGAQVLTGGTVNVSQNVTRLALTLPVEQQDKLNTVIRLDLDASAAEELPGGKPLDVPDPDLLSVDSPLNYQVFQRQSPGAGFIRVAGRIPYGTEKVEVRLTGDTVTGHAAAAWTQVPVDIAEGSFEYDLSAPAGGWYGCEIRALSKGEPIGSANVAHVGVGEVFIVAGQSNSSNHGSGRQQPRSGKVAAFDGTRWQLANDPQPGASGDGGSFIPAFGDAMVSRLSVPIGIAAVGVGGTSVREWLPRGDRMTNQPTTGANVRAVGPHEWEATGELFERLMRRLNTFGQGFRAVLWHQGESDAGQARAGYPADRQITGQQYRTYMERLIVSSRARSGWEIPWLTAQVTYHGEADPSDEEFRAAQAALWKSGLAIEGPDTDALRAEFRDGVHFNARGLQRHGELWAEKVSAWLERRTDRASRQP